MTISRIVFRPAPGTGGILEGLSLPSCPTVWTSSSPSTLTALGDRRSDIWRDVGCSSRIGVFLVFRTGVGVSRDDKPVLAQFLLLCAILSSSLPFIFALLMGNGSGSGDCRVFGSSRL